MRKLPLEGVRVLDISQVMAGPFACMLLADMGADVIKIEPPGTGDQTRGAMGFKMKGPDSLGFLNMNRNKRSVVLNLKSEAGRTLLLRLAKDADILVENYRPGAMKRLGLGYEDIKAVNPRLVYTSISGFGQTGPWADRPRFRFDGAGHVGCDERHRLSRAVRQSRPGCRWPISAARCSPSTPRSRPTSARRASGEGQYIDGRLAV